MDLTAAYHQQVNPAEPIKRRAFVYVSGGNAVAGPAPDDIEIVILDMDNAKEQFGGSERNNLMCPKCNEDSHEVAWNAATAHDFLHLGVEEDCITPIQAVNLNLEPDTGFTCPHCYGMSTITEILEATARVDVHPDLVTDPPVNIQVYTVDGQPWPLENGDNEIVILRAWAQREENGEYLTITTDGNELPNGTNDFEIIEGFIMSGGADIRDWLEDHGAEFYENRDDIYRFLEANNLSQYINDMT